VILPAVWRQRPWCVLLVSGALFTLPLLLYLYIPLRTAQGAAYQYMPVKTLSDLWYFVSQQEYQPHFRFAASVTEAVERMGHALGLWVGDLSVIGLAAGIVGLLVGIWRGAERRLFLALGLSVLSMMVFPLWYVDPDSMFIPLVMLLAIGAGMLVEWGIAYWRYTAWATGALLMIVTVLLAPGNFQFVRSLTQNMTGQNLIDAAAAIPSPCPAILSHWGWDLKAYQYGKIVTGQLACARIVTPNDDLRGILKGGTSLYAASHFFYQMSPDEFRQRVGSFYLNSAGPGIIEISKSVRNDLPAGLESRPTPMGAEITLASYHLKRDIDGALVLTLFWRAQARPSGDYSVFVHVSDKDEIAGPADIIAQADSQTPVYGWYPTSQWQAGEVVREDYRIHPPKGKSPRILAVGMYMRSATGTFENLGRVVIPVDAG